MSQETTTPPTIYRRGIWYLSDVVYERLTLFNYWEMLGFLCAVALSLVLVYPHKDLQARLAASEKLSPNDPLTLEYLRVFLRADPENHDLRLPFASRLIRLGLYHEAREVLTPLHSLNNADLHYQALWLELLIVEQEHYAIPKNSPLYAAAVARHFAHLRLILNQKLNAEQYIMLGQKAWTAGANDIAIESFRRLTLIPHLPGATYAAAALAMIGLGDYRGSAEMYFLAMKNSASLGEKRRYFMAGISTLQAASMFDVALATADRFLTIFIHDTETLVFLARFARAANRPELARRYAKLYMRMSQLDMPQYGWQAMPQPVGFNPNFLIHATWRGGAQADFLRVANSKPPVVSGDVPSLPFDDQAYLLAHDIFLGADKQDEAIRVAKAAVDQRPNSAPWRKRLANLYDWSGNYNESATQWLAYAKLTNDETAWDRVLGLARSMNDLDALRLVLEHKVRYEPKREGWLNELLNLYDVRGEPELQIKFLEGLFDETKDVELKEKYLLRQVEILEWRQDIEHALEKTLLLKKYFGRKVSYAKKLATFLARKRQFEAAFLELYIVRDQVPTDDEEFWHNYSEMGNFFQDDDASEEGYRALLDSGYDTETDLTNLLYLWSLPNPRAAAQLAVFAYFNAVKVSPLILEVRITSEANLINDTELRLINRLKSYPNVFAIAALDLFVKLLDWDSAHQFLNSLTPAQLRVLEEDVRFLSPRATMRQFTHDLVGAKKDLRAALDKTPDNMDLRAGLMWVLIASRDVEPLKQALVLWAGDAEDSEVLWAPFAAALMSLNRPNEALHWLRRAGIQRQDYLWQMSYADCLDANSQPDLAWRIRRRAWTDLRKPEVLQSISPKLFINMRDRLAALSSMFDTGDGAKRILQQLLRADVSAVQEASKSEIFPVQVESWYVGW
jgi:thioredoxin-like negative regulator of GroEL